MSHTPGPWKAGKPCESSVAGHLVYVPVYAQEGDVYLSSVNVYQTDEKRRYPKTYKDKVSGEIRPRPVVDRETMQANARLIAAAPELLEACKKAVAELEAHGYREVYGLAEMRAVIAKAEGK